MGPPRLRLPITARSPLMPMRMHEPSMVMPRPPSPPPASTSPPRPPVSVRRLRQLRNSSTGSISASATAVAEASTYASAFAFASGVDQVAQAGQGGATRLADQLRRDHVGCLGPCHLKFDLGLRKCSRDRCQPDGHRDAIPTHRRWSKPTMHSTGSISASADATALRLLLRFRNGECRWRQPVCHWRSGCGRTHRE